jgi:cytochrome P450
MTQVFAQPVPGHVPPELVVDFDFYHGPEVSGDPRVGLAKLHQGPDIFYTPRNGGHWVLTRARHAREVLFDTEHFSNDAHFNPRLDENGPRLIPNQIDPPLHTKYREFLNPLLSPAGIAGLREDIRRLAREVIESVRLKGGCEFFSEVSQLFPTVVFMQWAKLPLEDRPQLVTWQDLVTHDPTDRGYQAYGELCQYLLTYLRARRE